LVIVLEKPRTKVQTALLLEGQRGEGGALELAAPPFSDYLGHKQTSFKNKGVCLFKSSLHRQQKQCCRRAHGGAEGSGWCPGAGNTQNAQRNRQSRKVFPEGGRGMGRGLGWCPRAANLQANTNRNESARMFDHDNDKLRYAMLSWLRAARLSWLRVATLLRFRVAGLRLWVARLPRFRVARMLRFRVAELAWFGLQGCCGTW